MTYEKLDMITQEYLQKMKSEIGTQYPDEMKSVLSREHQEMVDEFVNMLPGRFEQYRTLFEFNIQWDALKRNCKEIIGNHIDNIERDGFSKKERDIIDSKVQDYLRTNKNNTYARPTIRRRNPF